MTTTLTNTRTRKQWAKEINLAWFKSVDDVCDVAELCAQAHSQLGQPEYNKMCAEDLQFSIRMAGKFKELGQRPDILRYGRARRLPQITSSLFEFLRMDEKSLAFAIENKLLDEQSNLAKSRAVAGALSTSTETPIGEDSQSRGLPSPKDANDVAKATGKMVAASDGKVYTGTGKDEQDQYNERRDQFYQTLDAISFLANLNSVDPEFFLANSEEWWTEKLSVAVIDDACEWLQRLKKTLEARQ